MIAQRKLLLLVLLAVTSLSRATEPEVVVLLHGVAMSDWVMRPLAGELQRAGYRVVNLRYPSRTVPVEELADTFLPDALARAGAERAPRLHFVAHSMGGIVVRLYLRDHHPRNLGRVVMLGTPNHGSAAADHAARSSWIRRLIGCNLIRLGTGAGSVPRKLGPAEFEVGIIAGTGQLHPFFNDVLPHPHDGVVTVESARLDGMRDFRIVPYSHTGMLWRRDVKADVIHFLRTGRFSPPASAAGETE